MNKPTLNEPTLNRFVFFSCLSGIPCWHPSDSPPSFPSSKDIVMLRIVAVTAWHISLQIPPPAKPFTSTILSKSLLLRTWQQQRNPNAMFCVLLKNKWYAVFKFAQSVLSYTSRSDRKILDRVLRRKKLSRLRCLGSGTCCLASGHLRGVKFHACASDSRLPFLRRRFLDFLGPVAI